MFHQRKVASMRRRGCEPLVLILQTGMTEHGAFELEKDRISYHRAMGSELCNFTEGGEGMSGHVPSAATRAKRSASLKGHSFTPETRAKMSAAQKKRFADPTERAKLSVLVKTGVCGMTGRKHSAETRIKMRKGGS